MSTQVVDQVVAPGLHRGLTYDQYAGINAMRHSTLKHFNRTAAHAREFIARPPKQTEAMALGHAAHVAILEPERFSLEFAAQPYMGDRKSSKVRAEEEKFRADHPDTTFLTQDEHAQCVAFRDAVWAHPMASALLRAPGRNEMSAVWLDAATGLPCKGRLDRLTAQLPGMGDWSFIVDVKTAKDASPRVFSLDLYKFHYEQQGAFYLDGLEVLARRPRKFIFVVIEKTPPYAVVCYELEEDAISIGRDGYQRNLRAYKQCMETGHWPGYDDGLGSISIPSWAFKFHGEEA